MTTSDRYWYCPFAYCYSNYSREGYSQHVLSYGDLPMFGSSRMKGTLGGTGLAVSAHSKNKQQAVLFAKWVASPDCQRLLYFDNGGQPGHRTAWLSERNNQRSLNFFRNLLPAIEQGFLRPRYSGYLHFQDSAGDVVKRYLQNGGEPLDVVKNINEIYQRSKNRNEIS